MAGLELWVDELETLGGAIEDIRAFCAVAEFGSISAAARQLGETKGGISRRITRLEQRLGLTLLARTPRAVSPTNEGMSFHAKAREALAWLDDAVESAQESQEKPQGHLRVTAPIDLGVDVLPDILVRFRAQYPQITVELLITDSHLDLAAHQVDLALRARVGILPDTGYRASIIAHLKIGLYAAPAYLDSHDKDPDEPAALAQHDMVLPPEFSGAGRLVLTNRQGRSEDVQTHPTFQASDYSSVLRLVIAGGGIGPIPDRVAAASITSGDIVPVLPQWHAATGTLYAISLSGRQAPARVRAFREFLRQELDSD